MKIDPEYVHSLYEKHGLKPCKISFGPTVAGKCCAMGIIGVENNFYQKDKKYVDVDQLDKLFGIEFRTGFTFGFDNSGLDENESRLKVKEGYENGQAVRAHLLKFYQF